MEYSGQLGPAFPLSSRQREIWSDQLLYPHIPFYHIGGYVRIDELLDCALFERALDLLITHNDALRLVVFQDSDGARQALVEDLSYQLPLVRLPGKQCCLDWMQTAFVKPMPLEGELLFRFALLQAAPDQYFFYLKFHHIIVDGWAISLITRRLADIYNGLLSNTEPVLAAPSYLDFLREDQSYLDSRSYTRDQQFWTSKYAQLPARLQSAAHYRHFENTSLPGDRVSIPIARTSYDRLDQFAAQNGVSTFQVILAVLAAYFTRVSDSDGDLADFVIGLPILNRGKKSFKKTIGLFAGMCPVRFQFEPRDFLQLVKHIASVLHGTYRHQRFPLSDINRLCGVHGQGRRQIFDITLSYEKQSYDSVFGTRPVYAEAFSNGHEQNALAIFVREYHHQMDVVLDFDFNLAAFSKAGVVLLASRIVFMLEQVTQPLAALSDFDLLPKAERRLLLTVFMGPSVPLAGNKTVVDLFEEQVLRSPEGIALCYEQQALTYSELNQSSNRLAHQIISMGIGPEHFVGVSLQAGLHMTPVLLAVLKSGAAYVPLNPELPRERFDSVVGDACLRLLITNDAGLASDRITCLAPSFSRGETHNPSATHHAHLPAYLFYTSGSTGKPKGVLCPHQSTYNHLLWMLHLLPAEGDACWIQKTPFSFDISIWEYLHPLLSGARLVATRPGGHRDPAYLLELIQQQQATHIHFVPSMLRVFLGQEGLSACTSLRRVFSGGEALPLDLQRRFFKLLSHGGLGPSLHNMYGPTEAAIEVTHHLCDPDSRLVPIGKAMDNAALYVVDQTCRLLPVGVRGQLLIGGPCLARGYHRAPSLTAQSFIPNPFARHACEAGSRLYCSGDLVHFLPDGVLCFDGRLDDQVKLRGFRIEPGEICAWLNQHPEVRQSAVVLRGANPEQQHLAAFFVPVSPDRPLPDFPAFLGKHLPSYMIPTSYTVLDALPLTSSGKLNRQALPHASQDLPKKLPAPPRGQIEKLLAEIWCTVLHVEKISRGDSFFGLGGHSLKLIEVQRRLEKVMPGKTTLMDLFRYPTLAGLAASLTSETSSQADVAPTLGLGDIAVIGMAFRFPGAVDCETFWRNLRDGVVSIEKAPLQAEANIPGRDHFVDAGGIIPDAECFDADFFRFSPGDAKLTDPQHRVFLELAWHTFEHAGYDPLTHPHPIGLFAGSGPKTHMFRHSPPSQWRLGDAEDFRWLIGNDKDFLATTVAYKLNLKGPCINVQTACSTSLVAVDMACKSLLYGDCQMALAGGVTILLPQEGYLFQEGMIFSPDGRCRPFDAKAAGTVPGSGAGAVLLKRLDQALADRDRVHAVIKGSAVNNDGMEKVGYTAPGVQGQAGVVKAALARAGVSAGSLGYLETHGTGTPLGDPIEMVALREVFPKEGSCVLGAVKASLGHLDTASGIAGLIKAVLVLKNRTFPPLAAFSVPNPLLDLENSPFRVVRTASPWPDEDRPRLAGVSSFGVGGTNAHVILEEAPVFASKPSTGPYPLVLSAKNPAALERMSENLARFLEHPVALADVAFTLGQGRSHMAYRFALVCENAQHARSLLRVSPKQLIQCSERRSVVFLFPGQSTQYPLMARQLYRHLPVFRGWVDRCLQEVTLDFDPLQLICPDQNASRQPEDMLTSTFVVQVVLFIIEYAMARTMVSLGVKPVALAGHSLGELVAATIAGVFHLKDALAVVAERGRLMQEAPPGAMLSVGLSQQELLPFLDDGLSLAVVNGPRLCVVSGLSKKIAHLEQILTGKGITCRFISHHHGFHSALLRPFVVPFSHFLQKVPLAVPTLPLISCYSGQALTPEEAVDPLYWAGQLTRPVRFDLVLETLFTSPDHLLLELGPGRPLVALAQAHDDRPLSQVALSILPSRHGESGDLFYLQTTLVQLWQNGVDVDWGFLLPGRQRVPLPLYPFERTAYIPDVSAAHELRRAHEERVMCRYFSWQQTPEPGQTTNASGDWLLFIHEQGPGLELARRLKEEGACVVCVFPGTHFERLGESSYQVDPADRENYVALFYALENIPQTLVHCWCLGHNDLATWRDSLIYLVQNLSEYNFSSADDGTFHLDIVCDGLADITGEEQIQLETAALLGLVQTVAGEYPALACRLLDLVLPHSGCDTRLVASLVGELKRPSRANLVGLRGHHRWERVFLPLVLPPRADGSGFRSGGAYLVVGNGVEAASTLSRLLLEQGFRVVLAAMPDSAQSPEEHEGLLAWRQEVHGPQQMSCLLRECLNHFGALNGLFFFSPDTDIESIEEMESGPSLPDLADTFAALPDDLDFVFTFSCEKGLDRSVGLLERLTNDAFLEAYAQRTDGYDTVPFTHIRLQDATLVGAFAQDPGVFINAGVRVLQLGQLDEPHVPVQTETREQTYHPRPQLRQEPVAAENEIQTALLSMWEECLHMRGIGIHDDFFELGGHSLVAIRVATRIREEYGVELGMEQLAEVPTVAGIALFLQAATFEQEEGEI